MCAQLTLLLLFSIVCNKSIISKAFKLGQNGRIAHSYRDISHRSTILRQSNDVDEAVSNELVTRDEMLIKLKAEATSPFRLLRQFIYGGMGAAGGLGTFTAIPQLILALQSHGDVENAVKNIAIDTGGVLLAVALWKFDNDNAMKKLNVYKDKQRVMDKKLSKAEMKEREMELSLLPVEIQVSEVEANITRVVSLGDLQSKGSQNVVIVAGPTAFIRDAIISARLESPETFASNNIIVIPFTLVDEVVDSSEQRKAKKGFGVVKQPELIEAPYIAKPQQVWYQYNCIHLFPFIINMYTPSIHITHIMHTYLLTYLHICAYTIIYSTNQSYKHMYMPACSILYADKQIIYLFVCI